jgi:hypothetical protein
MLMASTFLTMKMKNVEKMGKTLPMVVIREKRKNFEKVRIIRAMGGAFYESVFRSDLEETFRVQP